MNAVEKIQQEIKDAFREAVLASGLADESAMPDIILETPKNKENGDYATNIAMQLTKIAKKPPRAIAEAILEKLDTSSTSIKSLEIAGPGFHQHQAEKRLFRRSRQNGACPRSGLRPFDVWRK